MPTAPIYSALSRFAPWAIGFAEPVAKSTWSGRCPFATLLRPYLQIWLEAVKTQGERNA